MARYTFTCEHFDYDIYRGEENGVASKHTTEFRADDLTTMLENFEMFLRGSGFNFNGKLDFVEEYWNDDYEEDEDDESDEEPNDVIKHMMNDLQKNPITMKSNSLRDEFGDIFIESNDTKEYDDLDYGEAQPTLNVMTTSELENITLKFSEMDEKCTLCKLPKSVMQIHQCFDPQCPSGAYRNQNAY